jgi:hypothetical protein
MPFRFWHRTWWRQPSLRREVVGAYIGITLGAAAGWAATDHLRETTDHRLEAQIEQMCAELQGDRIGFRLFVSDIMEGARLETRERVFARLDARAPEVRVCGEPIDVPEPAPPLATSTTSKTP